MGVASPAQWRLHGSCRLPSWPCPFRDCLQGLSAPDHPVRVGWDFRPSRCATALVSLSACSDLCHPDSVTRCAGITRSPAGAHTPVVPGNHPDTFTPPTPGRALARPPGLRDLPTRAANPVCTRARAQADERPAEAVPSAGPAAAGCPAAPGESAEGPARITARHRSVGPVISLDPRLESIASLTRRHSAAAEPPPVVVASSPRHTARSLGALPTSPARVHSREVASPSADRCHPTRMFRPRGSIPTSAACSARRFPGCCTWYRQDFAGFPPAPAADHRAGCPARCPVWRARGFPAAMSHTPRRTRFPLACALGTRTLDPPHRVAAAVAPLPFSRLRGVARVQRPARSVCRCRRSSHA